MKPKLIAQQGNSIVIHTRTIPKEDSQTDFPERGFIYELGSDFRYPEQVLASIFAHCPYLEEPKIQLSDEEIQAIVNLPIRRGPGGPTQ